MMDSHAQAFSAVDRPAIAKIVASWPNRPKLAAEQMLTKYGTPQEVTPEKLVWHNQGPYKRITVTKAEHHHDFPKPHMDYLEHTIEYRVPPDRAEALAAYDGSLTFDRTRGEMSARCDLEGHNILTLNLAHDIVEGKLSAKQARAAFGEHVVEDAKGEYPDYTTALRFVLSRTDTKFADLPVIPGSPERPGAEGASAPNAKTTGDAEILGLMAAVDDNGIVGALEAGNRTLSAPVADYVKTLHKAYGDHLEATLKLGSKIDVIPAENAAVDRIRVKAAGELATLVPLEGQAFESAYVVATIKGQTEVLGLIDTQLLPRADNDKLKKHLTQTRADVAEQLGAAKALQAGL